MIIQWKISLSQTCNSAFMQHKNEHFYLATLSIYLGHTDRFAMHTVKHHLIWSKCIRTFFELLCWHKHIKTGLGDSIGTGSFKKSVSRLRRSTYIIIFLTEFHCYLSPKSCGSTADVRRRLLLSWRISCFKTAESTNLFSRKKRFLN